jgi:hypothetical protein
LSGAKTGTGQNRGVNYPHSLLLHAEWILHAGTTEEGKKKKKKKKKKRGKKEKGKQPNVVVMVG